MLFCLGDGKYESKGEGYQKNNRIFNKEVSKDKFEECIGKQPKFELPLCVWVEEKNMTEEEKKNKPIYSEIGGYLKELNYQDAWKVGWKTASKEFKDWVKGLPNFNADLFKKITSVDFTNDDMSSEEVEIIIRGKTYKAVIQ